VYPWSTEADNHARARRYVRENSLVDPLTGCWLWSRNISPSGYGLSGLTKAPCRSSRAHRLAYEVFRGLIPTGLQLDHLCRVRRCVNPDHLEIVTARENTHRSALCLAAVNARKTHCPQGHPYSGNNRTININGDRICQACSRAAGARNDAKRRGGPDRYRNRRRR
jgi:hypothetical protein